MLVSRIAKPGFVTCLGAAHKKLSRLRCPDYAVLVFPAVFEVGQRQPLCQQEWLGQLGKALPKQMPVSPGSRAGTRLGMAPLQGWVWLHSSVGLGSAMLPQGSLRVLRPGTRAGLVSITEKLWIAAEHPCRLGRM